MGVSLASAVVMWGVVGSLGLIAGLVLLRMATGGIALTGLLSLEKDAPFGFDRLQLVTVTLLFAGGYLVASLYRGPGDKMPDIPTPLLLVLIGSNGTYLAVKATMIGRVIGRGK